MALRIEWVRLFILFPIWTLSNQPSEFNKNVISIWIPSGKTQCLSFGVFFALIFYIFYVVFGNPHLGPFSIALQRRKGEGETSMWCHIDWLPPSFTLTGARDPTCNPVWLGIKLSIPPYAGWRSNHLTPARAIFYLLIFALIKLLQFLVSSHWTINSCSLSINCLAFVCD